MMIEKLLGVVPLCVTEMGTLSPVLVIETEWPGLPD
jgi:hypothetical protein